MLSTDDDTPVPLGGVMIDRETLRRRQGEKDFGPKLQVAESQDGKRRGDHRKGEEFTSRLRDLKLKTVHKVHKPGGGIKEVAEYVPDDE
ncbi:MAG: hypothetical protein ACYTKD_31695 [Planctomycetota bacterium]|jgi:hypothetical protein